ncbi:hypothetical protein HQ563_17710 [bacterium]|nr:hypothetical protein [bacterium]
MSRTFRILATFLCLISLLAGCGKEKSAGIGAAKFELVKPFTEVGAPVTVTVKASKKEITIADFLTLVVEVESEKGCRAKMPELKDLDFGQFLVKDHYRLSPREGQGGSEMQATEFTLEPQLSGEYTIAPFSVSYVLESEPPDSEGNPPSHEVKTEAVKITVNSLGAKDLESAKLRDIKPPVFLREPRRRRGIIWLVVSGGGLLLGGVVLFLVLRRRRKGIPPEKRIPAHILAFEELRRLRDMNLIEQGRIKEFYIAISNIMRFYIERRFGVHAPELTTEEFLENVSKDHLFDGATRNTLQQFLSHCDFVKFARYQPEMEEIQKTVDVTRDFIEQTKSEERK